MTVEYLDTLVGPRKNTQMEDLANLLHLRESITDIDIINEINNYIGETIKDMTKFDGMGWEV